MAILKSVAGFTFMDTPLLVSNLLVTAVGNQKKISPHPTFKEEGVDYGPAEIEVDVGMKFSLLGNVTLDQVRYASLCEGRLPMVLKGAKNSDLFATARCLRTWEDSGEWFLETQNVTYRLEGFEKQYGVRYALKFLWQELTRRQFFRF